KAGSPGSVGSPITYGPILATHFGRAVLRRADAQKYSEASRRAGLWLRQQEPKNVLEAASLLLALAEDKDWPAPRRAACLDLIRKGENEGGGWGWGPFVTAAAEPFDTALVLLALARQKDLVD